MPSAASLSISGVLKYGFPKQLTPSYPMSSTMMITKFSRGSSFALARPSDRTAQSNTVRTEWIRTLRECECFIVGLFPCSLDVASSLDCKLIGDHDNDFGISLRNGNFLLLTKLPTRCPRSNTSDCFSALPGYRLVYFTSIDENPDAQGRWGTL